MFSMSIEQRLEKAEQNVLSAHRKCDSLLRMNLILLDLIGKAMDIAQDAKPTEGGDASADGDEEIIDALLSELLGGRSQPPTIRE
jgi:hypothetical protein